MGEGSVPVDKIMQSIREHRSSESNFGALLQELDAALSVSEQAGNKDLTTDLEEVKDIYVAEYEKAKETGGSAWPEFEKFVTQFERSLTTAAKKND